MSGGYVTLSGAAEIRRLTLSRPSVRNAFDATTISELTSVLSGLATEPQLRVLIIAAEGDTFCAGADFRWMSGQKDATLDANIEDAQHLFDMFHVLYTFPAPTIARVQGEAYGGGAGLVACCDFVVLAEEATLAFSEVRIGLIPATISPFVIRRIGEGRAREMFLSGARISAQRALEIGLANAVVSSSALDSEVERLADGLRRNGPHAMRETKKLLQNVPGQPLDEVRTVTARWIAERRVSAEGQEGMAAFLERRDPRWTK
jgi:methylglutaconyl-CoA hydratase